MLHGGAQLPHVSRPGVTDDRLQRLGGEVAHRLGVLLGELAQKTQRQHRDVRHALTQGRRPKLHHAQPKIEVLAKLAVADHLLQVFVRRRDDSHVRHQRLVAADPLEGALAEKPQQLDLRRLVDIADLVEEQRAALGLLEPPDATLVRAGECPLLVAEQLALKQRRRQRSAVHSNHRTPRARAKLVDRLGQKLLAGAALALDQDSRPRRRHLPDDVHHLLHRLRLADDVLEPELFVELLLERLVFALEGAQLERAGDAGLELVNLHPPLGQVVVSTLLERLDRQLLRAVGGHQDADRRLGQRLGPGDQLHPVLVVRQPKVSQQHLERLRLEQVRRRGGILGHVHLVTILQRGAQSVAGRLLVVNNE